MTIDSELSSGQLYMPSKSCPLVSSQGRTVLDKRRPYLWLPDRFDGKPVFLKGTESIKNLDLCLDGADFAEEVKHYVPYFREKVRVTAGMTASSSSSASPPDKEAGMSSTQGAASHGAAGTSGTTTTSEAARLENRWPQRGSNKNTTSLSPP